VCVCVSQGDVCGLRDQVSALQEEVKSKQHESEAFANGERGGRSRTAHSTDSQGPAY